MAYNFNSYQEKVVDIVKTTDAIQQFVLGIDNILTGMYRADYISFDALVAQSLNIEMSGLVSELIKMSSIDATNLSEIKEFFTSFKADLKKIHQLKLVVAFDPSTNFVESLFYWVKRNVSGGILLNIEKNPDIIGGVVIIYKGIYRDFSLAPVLNNYFVERKGDVQKLLS